MILTCRNTKCVARLALDSATSTGAPRPCSSKPNRGRESAARIKMKMRLITLLAIVATSAIGGYVFGCDSLYSKDTLCQFSLELDVKQRDVVINGETKSGIDIWHSGARLQWSTNSIDWELFKHSKGISIFPHRSEFKCRFGLWLEIGGQGLIEGGTPNLEKWI